MTLSSSNRTEDFTLDALGNWTTFNDDGTSQTRTHNTANEITTISNGANPAHDATGNMTTIPATWEPTMWDANPSLTATYDAWNRLIKLNYGVDIGTYRYDVMLLRMRSRDEKALR